MHATQAWVHAHAHACARWPHLHLLGAPKQNSTLRVLECGCCGIKEDAVAKVKAALPLCKGLKHLGLFGNDDAIDDDLPSIRHALLNGKGSSGSGKASSTKGSKPTGSGSGKAGR